MTELENGRLDRLLTTLEANAVANTRLASEMGDVCRRVETQSQEIRDMAAGLERNTSATNKLVHEMRDRNAVAEKRSDRWWTALVVTAQELRAPALTVIGAGAAYLAAHWTGLIGG